MSDDIPNTDIDFVYAKLITYSTTFEKFNKKYTTYSDIFEDFVKQKNNKTQKNKSNK
jgi:hypothetical protein